MKTFTNIHSHVFTAKHSPDYFLETAIHFSRWPWLGRWLARKLNEMVQRRDSRFLLKTFAGIYRVLSPSSRSAIRRYIEFINIGTSSTQREIFDDIAKTHVHLGDYRIVVLTQVLDYLDLEQESNHIRIRTQVEQIADLKRNMLYQKNICPFLGVDPRMVGVDLVNDWAKKYIHPDYGFRGIKIYPAAGFFPFDTRLDELWGWAEKEQVPIMTHCTRGGSWYLGSFESVFNTGYIEMIGEGKDPATAARIRQRIMDLKKDKNIKSQNSKWTNIFGHPQNYRPVLEKYPRLKICLAHAGGSNEILRSHGKLLVPPKYPSYLQENWYDEVRSLMKDFENVYTDISYTISNRKAMKLFYDDNTDGFAKVMYGTDFYLTQQEKRGDESDLQKIFFGLFSDKEIERIAYSNPDGFIRNNIF
ncbi:MAG: amidohydrolase family protein [Chitinophagaceae bacterium]|nr:amidohydrolase family protein [Chitinophagaceae bacterium]